jgi:hypothetical protein
MRDDQVLVRPVHELRSGPNELVTMVAEELEVPKGLGPPRRGQIVTAGDDPGDRNRVIDVGLASGGVLPALTMGEERGHLSNVLVPLEQAPGKAGSVIPGSLDADDAIRPILCDPADQQLVASRVVGELTQPHGTTDVIEHRHSKRALVGVNPDCHTHPGLL